MLKQRDGEREEGKRERDNPWCYGCSVGKNRIEDEGILTGSTLLHVVDRCSHHTDRDPRMWL